MTAELEVEFHADLGACTRAIKANRIARPAGRGGPVQRPRDALENRRLAGSVGSDDAR